MCLIKGHKARTLKTTYVTNAVVDERLEIWYKVVRKRMVRKKTNKHRTVNYYTPYQYNKIELGKRLHDPHAHTIMYSGYDRPQRGYITGYHFYNIKGARKLASIYWNNRDFAILACLVINPRIHGKDIFGTACVSDTFIAMHEVPI